MATKTALVPTKKEKAQPLTLITQAELTAYKELVNAENEAIEARKLKATELINLINAGCQVEKGLFSAEASTSFRRNPSWKDEAICLADQLQGAGKGEIWAQAVIDRTEPSPSTRLVVK